MLLLRCLRLLTTPSPRSSERSSRMSGVDAGGQGARWSERRPALPWSGRPPGYCTRAVSNSSFRALGLMLVQMS